MTDVFEIWILCVAAHCYGDFLLQTDRMEKGQRKLSILLLHAAIHGGLAYLVLQQWSWWALPLAVFLVHGLIDFVKVRNGGGPRAFALDQGVHALSLWGIALAATLLPTIQMLSAVMFRDWILLGAGFTAAVWGVGHFIAAVANEMCDHNPDLKENLNRGLKNGGATIGTLERALIFILIGIGQPAGIGFLVAAKSILRFEEAKKQSLAEYVLIGTLWSFTLAIGAATVTFYLIS